ncbi:efflux RND transporter periplasmic adaptor subunit [Sinimarinibacterium flocculans]|uniref:efflux RND transporter periplasmic adaptor subunit n=1 Tax=Sinimarinibacterium flocculans TaxID=985250 RepID=UPI0024932617|nr:efflux RND transporter periplasmic adaptor subunit [Sinimarinibacterium flocculans]
MTRFSRQLCLLLCATLPVACSQPSAPPPQTPEVGVLRIEPRPATIEAEYVAQLDASNTVEIRPRVGGLLEQQVAVEGETVEKGQLLFVIDRQPYIVELEQAKAALAQARAGLQQAERDLARVQPLSELDAVSQQELDSVTARESAGRAAVQAAQAAVRSAELNLEYTRVTSPVDGVVGRAQFRVGGLVTAYQSLLTTVYDTNPMYVNFSISERRMLELQEQFGARPPQSRYDDDNAFKLMLSDGSVYPHPAHLNLVDAAVDRETGTLPIRLEVANPDGLLRAGQFARVVVVVDRIDAALLVPQRAVQELQGRTSLWVLREDGTVDRRDVRMGARVGGDWIVEEGLQAGETIVVDGLQRLRPGIAVSPQKLEPAGVRDGR